MGVRPAVVAVLLLLPVVAACSVPPTVPPPGPHEVATVPVPASAGFGGGTVYYPADDPGPFGVVSLSPGFTETEAAIQAWGPHLASEGFVVIAINTSNIFIFPDQRSTEQRQAIDYVVAQGGDPSSPLSGIVDANRTAVGGHSMGGGASLISAAADPDIDAVVPLAPWNLVASFPGVSAPTLILACQNDAIAPVANHASPMYDSIPTAEKMFVSVAGGDHFCANTPEAVDGDIGTFATAFLHRWVDGDASAGQLLCGPDGPSQGPALNEVRDTCPF
ncbi:MAG: alpha/beta hydrolase family protein [Acidimicrobiales bacterium]